MTPLEITFAALGWVLLAAVVAVRVATDTGD